MPLDAKIAPSILAGRIPSPISSQRWLIAQATSPTWPAIAIRYLTLLTFKQFPWGVLIHCRSSILARTGFMWISWMDTLVPPDSKKQFHWPQSQTSQSVHQSWHVYEKQSPGIEHFSIATWWSLIQINGSMSSLKSAQVYSVDPQNNPISELSRSCCVGVYAYFGCTFVDLCL